MASQTQQPPLDWFTIGWVCAIDVEFEAALRMLDENFGQPKYLPEGESNAYCLGRIDDHFVVVTLLAECGTIEAASSLADMARTFASSLRFALMVGVAGGIPLPPDRDVRLGDIVIGHPVGSLPGTVHYGRGKETNEGYQRTGTLNKPPGMLTATARMIKSDIGPRKHQYMVHFDKALEGDEEAREQYRRPQQDRLFRAEYVHPSGERDCAKCAPEEEVVVRGARTSTRPRIHLGTVVSGNMVVKNAALRDEIGRTIEGALCVEMSAAGLMQKLPCFVVRGICDYADSHKNNAWEPYAALVAASFAKELILRLPIRQEESGDVQQSNLDQS
ncbi:purine and uridine phosphorylase [Aspergillus unguis]